jgi:hypothetical protein
MFSPAGKQVEKRAKRDEKEYRSSIRLKAEKMSELRNCDHLFSQLYDLSPSMGDLAN